MTPTVFSYYFSDILNGFASTLLSFSVKVLFLTPMVLSPPISDTHFVKRLPQFKYILPSLSSRNQADGNALSGVDRWLAIRFVFKIFAIGVRIARRKDD